MSGFLLLLRLVIGLLFIGHGAQKTLGLFGGPGPSGTGRFFSSVGLRPGKPMAVAAGAAEMAGGKLLVLGLGTPVAAGMLSAVMGGAIASVHAGKGPWVTQGGWEYNLVLLTALYGLASAGPGDWSLDRALGTELTGPRVGAIAVLAGTAAGLVPPAIGALAPGGSGEDDGDDGVQAAASAA